MEAGADINHPNETNSTPLRAASYHNRVEVIVYLLNQGADISISNHVGQAPVMISVLRENEEALRSLGNLHFKAVPCCLYVHTYKFRAIKSISLQ